MSWNFNQYINKGNSAHGGLWDYQSYKSGGAIQGEGPRNLTTKRRSMLPDYLPHFTGPGFYVYRPPMNFNTGLETAQQQSKDLRQFVAPAWIQPPTPQNIVIDNSTTNFGPALGATAIGLGITGLLTYAAEHGAGCSCNVCSGSSTYSDGMGIDIASVDEEW